MTAPDLEVVIMEALAGTSDCDKDDYRAQAHAVLAAISEAGAVEWGTEHVIEGKRAIEFHTWPNKRTAQNKVAIFGGRVVSRITGPWTAVEG